MWYERTMEKKTDYQVYSNPLTVDGDADGMNDFSEFLNGSDPGRNDTDGDGIRDKAEVDGGYNVTGVEGTPPKVENVQLSVSIRWDWLSYVYLPVFATIQVDCDVSDNVGIDSVVVKVVRVVGAETHTAQITAGSKGGHVHEAFGFSLLEAALTGADVNISAYDTNGNGAWGEFHVDSIAQAVVKAIVAYFTAIANVIVEAVSAAFDWIWAAVSAMVGVIIKPVVDAVQDFERGLENLFADFILEHSNRAGAGPIPDGLQFIGFVSNSGLFWGIAAVWIGATAVETIITVVAPYILAIKTQVTRFMKAYILDTMRILVAASLIAAGLHLLDSSYQDPRGGVLGAMFSVFDSNLFDTAYALSTIIVAFLLWVLGTGGVPFLRATIAFMGLLLLTMSSGQSRGIVNFVLDLLGMLACFSATVATIKDEGFTGEIVDTLSIVVAISDFLSLSAFPIAAFLVATRDYSI